MPRTYFPAFRVEVGKYINVTLGKQHTNALFFLGTNTNIVLDQLDQLHGMVVENARKTPFQAYLDMVDAFYPADIFKGFWPMAEGNEPVPTTEVSANSL